MTVIVAVTYSPEGSHALTEAVAEAKHLGTDLVAVNLGAKKLDAADIDADGVTVAVVNLKGRGKKRELAENEVDSDPVDAVLNEITKRNATRLVIGVKRRSPVGKVILGSLSQRLLLNSPVPVLAVKLPEEEGTGGLPSGLVRVTG